MIFKTYVLQGVGRALLYLLHTPATGAGSARILPARSPASGRWGAHSPLNRPGLRRQEEQGPSGQSCPPTQPSHRLFHVHSPTTGASESCSVIGGDRSPSRKRDRVLVALHAV